MAALLTNATADGPGTSILVPATDFTLTASGVLDGARVFAQYSDDGGTTWHNLGDHATFTSTGGGNASLPTAYSIRGNVYRAGTLTSVSLEVEAIA